MRRRILALGGAAVLAVTGCSGGAHPTSTPSTRPPSATTTAPNPDVVPNRITPAYVDAVFAKLNHIYGNATRDLVRADSLTAKARSDLRAIYNDPLFSSEITIAEQSITSGFQGVREPPGDRRTSVMQLITATKECIFVRTTTDFSAVLIHATPPAAAEYYELAPKQAGDDPSHLNATPWALSFNEAFKTPTTIRSTCDAS